MRIASLFAVVLALSPISARADTPYLNDVMKRTEHQVAYERMVKGEKNLPSWMATPRGVIGGTNSAGSDPVTVEGHPQRVFYACKNHDCDTTNLVVMFDEEGYATAILMVGKKTRFLGDPNAEEMKVLLARATANR